MNPTFLRRIFPLVFMAFAVVPWVVFSLLLMMLVLLPVIGTSCPAPMVLEGWAASVDRSRSDCRTVGEPRLQLVSRIDSWFVQPSRILTLHPTLLISWLTGSLGICVTEK